MATVYDFEVSDINDNAFDWDTVKGFVTVIVNVAAKCGLTQQSYTHFKYLQEKYDDKIKFMMFPSNSFFNQGFEKKEEIINLRNSYSDKFILMAPCKVTGNEKIELWKYLIKEQKGFLWNDVKWNFTKFLIDKNGKPVKRYGPKDNVSEEDIDKLISGMRLKDNSLYFKVFYFVIIVIVIYLIYRFFKNRRQENDENKP